MRGEPYFHSLFKLTKEILRKLLRKIKWLRCLEILKAKERKKKIKKKKKKGKMDMKDYLMYIKNRWRKKKYDLISMWFEKAIYSSQYINEINNLI